MMTNSMNLSLGCLVRTRWKPLPVAGQSNRMDLSGLLEPPALRSLRAGVAEGLCCHPPGTVGVAEPNPRPAPRGATLSGAAGSVL